jgi:hypothetical protein
VFIADATGKENAKWVTEAADEIERIRSIAIERMDLFRQAATNVEQADARIAELTKALEWQPIETAPKDEKWVLVWERYINTKYHPAEVARYRDGKWRNSANKIVDVVTHWMPIPGSPVVPLERSGGAT